MKNHKVRKTSLKKNIFSTILFLWFLFITGKHCFGGDLQRFIFEETVMSIPARIIICAENESDAKSAANAVFQRFDELNKIMSDYDSDSEVMRICQIGAKSGEPVQVSNDLFRVLQFSKQISIASDGAFDVTIGPVIRLWRRARRLRALPEKELLDNARQLVGNALWEIDEKSQTVTLKRDKMRFDLGGVAKGDAIDQAVEVLKTHKIPAALVDVGGDIRSYGQPPTHSANSEKIIPNIQNSKISKIQNENDSGVNSWIIGVSANGQAICHVAAQDVAMASSGDAERFVEWDGVRYSHIVDPKTGLGLTDHKAVTVFAKDAITADALASALSILPPEKGLKLLEQYEGTAAMICRKISRLPDAKNHSPVSQSETEFFYSPNWKNLNFQTP
ncbi:MAG: FAD:protein FMN transferase [Planctomycetaceae bacterium]|nr:FAD:protein FMN transferase [Planctomycetaceae bacterium]